MNCRISGEVPQRAKNRSTRGSSYTTAGHTPKGLCILLRDTCSFMLIAALLAIARKWKQPLISTGEWIIKMWYTHNGILFIYKEK